MPELRRASERDLAEIVAIYNHYVLETPITFDIEPFTEATRRPWFESFDDSGPHQLFVAEDDGRIAGYAWSSAFRPKAAYETTIETSIYLEPSATGKGLGKALYGVLFDAIAGQELHRAIAAITAGNPASVALHERFGFRSLGVLTQVGRKFDRYWDVEWFEKPLGSG